MANMRNMIQSLSNRQGSDESEDSVDERNIPLIQAPSTGKSPDMERYSYQFGWMNNKKFIKQLQKDNIDLAVLQSEIGSVNNKRRQKTWKERLLHVIRSNVVQIILCALVLIDAVIVIAEIILEIKAITSEKHELEVSFIQTAAFLNETFLPFLADNNMTLPSLTEKLRSSPQFAERLSASVSAIILHLSTNMTISCETKSALAKSETTLPAHSFRQRRAIDSSTVSTYSGATLFVSDSSKIEYSHAKMLHNVSGVLHFVSIGILGLFVLEVGLKILCLGRNFVREKFEIVDAVVIIISFVADIVFVKVDSNEVSFMVLFLLWRIVRVINGLMMHEKQRDEFRIQLQKRARRMSEMKCDSLETERDLQEKHIMFLEELCKDIGATDEQIGNCKPRYVNISKRQSNNALKSMAAMSAGIFGGIAGAQHRRSLNVLTNNLGTPTTSRQSSALDTIAEDADNRSSQSDMSTPPLANGKSPAFHPLQRFDSRSSPNTPISSDSAAPLISNSVPKEQPISANQVGNSKVAASPTQKLSNFKLKRQKFYVEGTQEEDREKMVSGSSNPGQPKLSKSCDYNLGGQFYSDSEDEDPWEFRKDTRAEAKPPTGIANKYDIVTEYLATT